MNTFLRLKISNLEINIVNFDNTYDSKCNHHKRCREIADYIVQENYNETICRKQNGAPFFASNSKHLSISHTEHYVATCVSDTPCGIDIEKSDRNASKIARKFCLESESEIALEIYPKNPHLLVWCAKEALYKRFSIDGAEFLKDFEVISRSSDNSFKCIGFEQPIILHWVEYKDLLIVFG